MTPTGRVAPAGRVVADPVMRARSYPFLVAFVVVALTYGAMDFLLIPENRLPRHPVHHDDYTNLAQTIPAVGLRSPRPVSALAIAVLATTGPRAYYLVLTLLTLLYPALVVLFLARLVGRNPSPLAIGVGAALLFSLPASLDWVKYTGLLTNLLSGIFGVLALLAIHRALLEGPRRRLLAVGLAFYAISIFSKEDFVLPVLVLLGSHLFRASARRRAAGIALLSAAACVLALILYNSRLPDSYTRLDASGPYEVRFAPGSVASTFFRYLTLHPFLVGISIFAVVTAIATAVAVRESRRPIVLVGLMTVSLILPYSVLPNHVAPYYPFGWLAWLTGLIAICLTLLADRLRRTALVYLPFAVVAILAVLQTQRERKAIVRWYGRESDRNERMTRTLIANRAALEPLDVVGVLGVSGLSPWSRSNGDYLRIRLRLANRWIVFVPRSDMFYTLNRTRGSVDVRPLSLRTGWPDLPLLVFDESGSGRLVRPASASGT